MREQELADRRIEREAVHALARRVDEHRARAVDDVARGDLTAARLQHVFELAVPAARDLPNDGEDRADRHVDVDVRRAVERIEQQAVLAALEVLGNLDDARLFLGRHGAQPAAVVHRLDDDLVGEHVELLLHLALHVLVVGGAEDVGEPRAADLVGDHLGGERQVVQDARELTRRFRVVALFLDDETLDRDDRRCGVLDHVAPSSRRWTPALTRARAAA